MKEILVSCIISLFIFSLFYFASEHKSNKNTLILLNAIAEHNEKILEEQKKSQKYDEDHGTTVYIYENDDIIEFYIEDKSEDKEDKS